MQDRYQEIYQGYRREAPQHVLRLKEEAKKKHLVAGRKP